MTIMRRVLVTVGTAVAIATVGGLGHYLSAQAQANRTINL
jgi:hypothetical protein